MPGSVRPKQNGQGQTGHEKSCDLGDTGLRKILQILEDLKRITNNPSRKASRRANMSGVLGGPKSKKNTKNLF